MSKETLTRCDMCGRACPDGTEQARGMAVLYRVGWDETLDLCRDCADEVQRFIAAKGDAGSSGTMEVRP